MAGLGGPAVAFNRDQTKLMVLHEFPECLQRSSIDRRIKDTNTKLKRIANEKKDNRLSVFQGSNNKKEKKKNNSGEDDLTYGPRDYVIVVVDRIKTETLDMDYFCLGCHVEIMGPYNELLETSYSIGEDDNHVSCAICGSTGDCLVCKNGSFSSCQLAMDRYPIVRYHAKDAVVLLPLGQFHHQNNPTASFSLALRLGLKKYSLTVSPTAEKLPLPRFIPIDICPRKGNLLFASSYSTTISEPSTTPLIHCDLNWVSPDGTDHIRHEGCPRLGPTSSGVRIKIIEQNFNTQLEQVINNDHPSISSLLPSREPFFIKYPWILEDIVV
ncbi:hypothetical protein DAPPUDRAFT_245637 [Daphnia pulex]|uniref:Uncharacterized protein n=1 Tax=Daphnia pulex TaxID=6669 RepID=E9GNR1_DAPPU|nr:hypothetical protein DAPPUDRAFT_245637 [Daphnia pulex]|eukprot:EFX78805.1 hypothetical protein DAPPUDRAFT_245637 [Daphnia pulex]